MPNMETIAVVLSICLLGAVGGLLWLLAYGVDHLLVWAHSPERVQQPADSCSCKRGDPKKPWRVIAETNPPAGDTMKLPCGHDVTDLVYRGLGRYDCAVCKADTASKRRRCRFCGNSACDPRTGGACTGAKELYWRARRAGMSASGRHG